MFSKGLLSADQFDRKDLLLFFKRVKQREFLKKRLQGRTGCLLFFEPSTRTKLSFEKAGLDLGIRWMSLEASRSSLSKKESLRDMYEVIAANEPDLLVVRDQYSGIAHFAHHWTKIPVINAGDGVREHPTQALLDAFTLWETDPKKKWKIVIFGDVFRSRVVRSHLPLFKKLGYPVSVVNDGSLETARFCKTYGLRLVPRSSTKKTDVVICLRVQQERGSEKKMAPLSIHDFGRKTKLMHPGPAVVGVDLTMELSAKDFPPSLIHRQRQNGRFVRSQLMKDILS